MDDVQRLMQLPSNLQEPHNNEKIAYNSGNTLRTGKCESEDAGVLQYV